MMKKLCVNTLSASQQCNTRNDIERLFRDLLECIGYLLPGVEANRLTLIYDARIEARQLKSGESFHASLNSLKASADNGRDLLRRWYMYTRNHMNVDATGTATEVSITSDESPGEISGEVCSSVISTCSALISFGGTPLNEARTLQVASSCGITAQIANAFHVPSVAKLLPIFEPSTKHRKVQYTDERGETVAAMPLSKTNAQELLLSAILHQKDHWAFHKASSSYYRFKPTREEEQIFHGFVVDEAEVPSALRAVIRGDNAS